MTAIEQILASIGRASACEEVFNMLAQEGRRHGFSVVAIGELPGAPGTASLPPFFWSNWPREWNSFYRDSQFAGRDPVVEAARRATLPFDWEELEAEPERWGLAPATLQVISTARQFAAEQGWNWKTGWAVPIHGPHGYVGVASWCGSARDFGARERADLHVKSLHAHERMLALHRAAFHKPEQIAAAYDLQERHLQVLRGLAAGKSDAAIAQQARLSERTIQHYVTQTKAKLGCHTRAQLAATASRLRIV